MQVSSSILPKPTSSPYLSRAQLKLREVQDRYLITQSQALSAGRMHS